MENIRRPPKAIGELRAENQSNSKKGNGHNENS